jgi:hypothetical protein
MDLNYEILTTDSWCNNRYIGAGGNSGSQNPSRDSDGSKHVNSYNYKQKRYTFRMKRDNKQKKPYEILNVI